MKYRNQVENLFALQSDSAPDIGRNGVYFVRTSLSKEKNTYVSDIMYRPFDAAEESVYVSDGSENASPVETGDGLYYLSNRTGTFQIYRLRDGLTEQMTAMPNGAECIVYSAKHSALFFTTNLAKSFPDVFTYDDVRAWEESSSTEPPFWYVKELGYHANGIGFRNTEEEHVIMMQDLDTGKLRRLHTQTTGYNLRGKITLTPQEDALLFEDRLRPENPAEHDTGAFRLNLTTFETEHLTEGFENGIFGDLSMSADGRYIAAVGNDLPYETPNQLTIYLYDRETGSWSTPLAERDLLTADVSVSDAFRHIRNPLTAWYGNEVYFLTSEKETVYLNAYDVKTGELRRLSRTGASVKEFCIREDRLCTLTTSSENPFDLRLKNLKDGSETVVNPKLQRETAAFEAARYRSLDYVDEEGQHVHGILVYPVPYDENRTYPILVNVHGGPYMMHAHVFYHEVQVQAAQECFVLLPNPRGSYGYGQKHVRAVYERYGKEDARDVLELLDRVEDEVPQIDRNREHITGGSYGGFMTNWLVTQTDRFQAAVSQRSMSNFLSMFGTSDIGFYFYKGETGHDISDPEFLWKSSPLAYADRVKTPILLIHALEDLRCPFEQAQQFFTAIRYFGGEAQMLVFPDSNHELSRSGLPSYRLRRLEGMLNFLKTYGKMD